MLGSGTHTFPIGDGGLFHPDMTNPCMPHTELPGLTVFALYLQAIEDSARHKRAVKDSSPCRRAAKNVVLRECAGKVRAGSQCCSTARADCESLGLIQADHEGLGPRTPTVRLLH